MKLKKITLFLDKELRVKKIPDSSANGLQVKAGRGSDIKKIGFAVDGCLSTFQKAKAAGVQLLIVHHGIRWKPEKRPELLAKRKAFAEKCRLSVYAAHLPLDEHPVYGNNAGLVKMLGMKQGRKFGEYEKTMAGFMGYYAKPVSLGKIKQMLDKNLRTNSKIYAFGKKSIKRVGIVSGGGSFAIREAALKKLDCLITGDINLGHSRHAQDYGISVIAAGHYATETVGVKALMPLLKEKFNVETVFIDDKMEL
jgi:dinuclear metal center YbgI/SA1388 family protein